MALSRVEGPQLAQTALPLHERHEPIQPTLGTAKSGVAARLRQGFGVARRSATREGGRPDSRSVGVPGGSDQPCQMSNLPPRSKNGFRLKLSDASSPPSIRAVRSTSAAMVVRRGSHEGSFRWKFRTRASEFLSGSGPPSLPHSSSEPGRRCGSITTFPVAGSLKGDVRTLADSTCAGVRHEGPSG